MFLRKHCFFSIICDKCGSMNEKLFKEEESTEISKILGLIENIEGYQTNHNYLKNHG